MQTWIYLAIATAGFVMGLTFKVPFVIASSIALTAAITAVAVFDDWPILTAFGTVGGALLALQTSYLLGLTASSACHKLRLRK